MLPRSLLFLLPILFLAGCASGSGGSALAGLWVEDSPGYYQVTLRNADGTFLEKTAQVYQPGHPPVEYESTGHWSLRGRQYIIRFQSISVPRYQKFIGHEVREQVHSITADTFTHSTPSGSVVQERRIGDAAMGLYQKAPLQTPRR